MSKRNKRVIVALAAVIVLVAAASAALRMMLTRDRLVSILIPRIEKAVDAKVSVGEIGIRFPFGFGVEARDVSFDKKVQGTGEAGFRSGKVVLKVSLISLLRRRPDIEKFDLSDASVSFFDTARGSRIELSGVDAGLVMNPSREGYNIRADVAVPLAVLTPRNGAGEISIEDIGVRGTFSADRKFTDLGTEGAVLTYGKLVEAKLSGDLKDARGKRIFSAKIEAGPIDAAALAARAEDLAASSKGGGGSEGAKPAALPGKVTSGSLRLIAEASGSAAEPDAAKVSGVLGISDVVFVPDSLELPVKANGEVSFSRSRISSSKIDLSSGRSSLGAGFEVTLGERFRPDTFKLSCDIYADIAGLSGKLLPGAGGAPAVKAGGSASGKIGAAGSVAALARLVPAGKASQAVLEEAWKQIGLKGRIELTDVFFSSGGSPVSVRELDGGIDISGPDVTLSGTGFRLNGSPWEASADLKRILPAAAAAAAAFKKAGTPSSISTALAAVTMPADISIRISGRSFDTRPLEKAGKEKKAAASGKNASAPREQAGAAAGKETPADASGKAASADGAQAGAGALAANPLALFILKRSGFEARLDSLVTTKAVFTAISASGKVRDGIVTVPELSTAYSGGRGRGSARIDLVDQEGIRSDFDMVFEGVEAGKALSPIHSMGRLLSGTFSFRASGDVLTGEGINPLMKLGAKGDATSTGGMIDLTSFIAPVSSLSGMDLSRLEKFDFKDWKGDFTIEGGRLKTSEWKIGSDTGDWDISGSFGFDGTLAYKARLSLTPGEQKKIPDLGKYRDLVDLFKDDSGNLILDLDIGGTAKSPKVKLDQSRAQQKAQEKITDQLKDKASDALKNLFKKKDK